MEPQVVAVDSDDEGVLVDDLAAKVGSGAGQGALPVRAAQLPEPHRPHHERGRAAPPGGKSAQLGLPLVEDNPYGDLWFDNRRPRP